VAALELADLLRTIDDDFDNLDHWHPLADWLIERDDPRGELINLDLALEAGVGDEAALQQRRAEILKDSAAKLLGDTFARVIADGYGAVNWRRGFVDGVRYAGDRSLRHRKAVSWLIKLITTVHEPFTFMRVLDLSYTDITDLRPLIRFRHLAKLDLRGCQPTAVSIEGLRAVRPNLAIITP
jgi:hypothetical protein